MRLQEIRLFIFALLISAPVWIYASDKNREVSDHSMAAQIEQRLAGVAPNAIVVVVDENNKTAYVRGSVNNQEQIANITEALRTFDGVRVIGSNLTIHSETPSVKETNRDYRNETPAVTKDETAVVTNDETPVVTKEQPDDVHFKDQTTEPYGEAIVPSDSSLNAAVIDALKSEGIMGQSKMRVETENGVVTLTGIALSEAQADRIVELARSVPGVVGINSNIQLRDERRPYKVKPTPDVDKEGHPVDHDDDDK